MGKEVKVLPLRGITIKGMQQCIEDTLQEQGLFSPDLLYRFYIAKRIPIVQATGNDRVENGYEKSKLELEAASYGYDIPHTIWADTFDNLRLHTNEGRNLLLLSAVSVYDKSKTKSRPQLLYGSESGYGGNSTYHVITTEDPKDALVAVFKRSNSPMVYALGKGHLTFTQGPVALWESLVHDFENVREYLKR